VERAAAAPSDRSHLPRTSGHRPRGTPRRSPRTRLRAASLITVHLLILAHVAHWRVTGRSLSPLEPSEAMQTFELGYVNAGVVLLLLSVAATLVVGRFFCGWACHVVAYQDLCAGLLARAGLKPRPLRSRVLVWVPLGAAFYMFAWPSLSRLARGAEFPAWRAHFLSEDLWATFPGPWIAALTLLVDGALIVWLLGSKGFCTYGCPYGALYALAERGARGRIRVTDACEGCGHCTASCTSNVQVHAEVARFGQVVDPGCMRCMDCVSVCPKQALYFGFGASRGAALRAKRAIGPARRWDCSWGEELALAALFLAGLYAWRNLYGVVPFLLAIGLAVIGAVTALALARALALREFTFQHWTLVCAGRPTAAGWAAGLAILGLLGSTAHAGAVQFCARSGEQALIEAGALERGPARVALLERSAGWLERARAWGWLPQAKLEYQLGAIRAEQDRGALAESHLRRALELDPSMRFPRLVLADLLKRAGRDAEAVQVLEALLAIDPANAEALRRLGRLAP
jgi:polyferredoxin